MDNNQEIKDGVSLKDILNDKNGVLKDYADKHNINFDADRLFVAFLFFREHNVDLVDVIFKKFFKSFEQYKQNELTKIQFPVE